jgi:HK97 family phage major capsid protein
MQLPALSRAIKSGAIDPEKRTVSFSFSSRTPVKRFFGYEILSHDEKAVDLRRLRAGAVPLLLNHDWDRQIGRVVAYEIRAGKGYAVAQISRSDLGDEILNDLADQIRTNISVGYIPRAVRRLKRDELDDALLDDDDEEEDDKDDEDDFEDADVFSVDRWEPLEVSIVSVPADTSVGIGRAEDLSAASLLYEVRELDATITGEVILSKESAMADAPIITPETQVTVVTEDLTRTRETEFTRMREIQRIGQEFGFSDDAAEYVRTGRSIAEFQTMVMQNLRPPTPVRTVEPNLGLKPRDLRKYSIVRAINKLSIRGGGPLDGLEGEISAELARIHGEQPQGFFAPDFIAGRDMVVGTPNLGGVTVQTTVEPEVIPLLRNQMVVLKAGARLMTGLVGNMSLPRQNAAATVTWNTEIAPLVESDQGLDAVQLAPNRVGGWTNYSKKLLAQSSIDVESFVRNDLVTVVAIAQDQVAINGSGTNQPIGILQTPANATAVPPYDYTKTAPSVVFAAAGPPTWANVLAFEGNLEVGNLLLDESAAYITTPAVKAAWKALAKADPRATNQFYPAFIWESGDQVNGCKAFATNLVPGNKVIFGKWNELIIAQWAGLDIVVDPYTLAANAEVRIIVNMFCDIKYRYSSAFCYSTNSGVTNP